MRQIHQIAPMWLWESAEGRSAVERIPVPKLSQKSLPKYFLQLFHKKHYKNSCFRILFGNDFGQDGTEPSKRFSIKPQNGEGLCLSSSEELKKAVAVSEEKIQQRSRRCCQFSSSRFPCRKVLKPWQGWHFVLPENRGRIFQQRRNLPENLSSKEFRTATAFSSFLSLGGGGGCMEPPFGSEKILQNPVTHSAESAQDPGFKIVNNDSEDKIQQRSRRRGRMSSSHFPCQKMRKPWQG